MAKSVKQPVKTEPARTVNRRRESEVAAAQRRWEEEDQAAWDAIRGMWADRKIDAVAYQRRLRRERTQPAK